MIWRVYLAERSQAQSFHRTNLLNGKGRQVASQDGDHINTSVTECMRP